VKDLDTTASEPSIAFSAGIGIAYSVGNGRGVVGLVAADVVEAEKSTSKPEHSREKRKSDISLPSLTITGSSDIVVVVAFSAMHRTDEINEQSKGNNPEDEEDQINRPVNESASEWEKPEESEEDGDGADYFGVDEAFLVPVVDVAGGVEVVGCETDYDCCEGELAKAKSNRSKT